MMDVEGDDGHGGGEGDQAYGDPIVESCEWKRNFSWRGAKMMFFRELLHGLGTIYLRNVGNVVVFCNISNSSEQLSRIIFCRHQRILDFNIGQKDLKRFWDYHHFSSENFNPSSQNFSICRALFEIHFLRNFRWVSKVLGLRLWNVLKGYEVFTMGMCARDGRRCTFLGLYTFTALPW